MSEALSEEELKQLLAALPLSPETPEEEPESNALTIEEDVSGVLEHRGSPIIINGRALPGCRIKTDDFVTIKGGVTGADISAGKGITAPFAEMSRLVCQDDLLITSHLLDCTVFCAGGIYCSPGSFINKGNYRAYYTIQADVLGHPVGTKTVLQLLKSDPLLTKPFDMTKKGDIYHHKLVGLKKVWKGTDFIIHDLFYNCHKDWDGPFVLDISQLGGRL